jgi:threonine/homoserine/homoserine lactone efflux protein
MITCCFESIVYRCLQHSTHPLLRNHKNFSLPASERERDSCLRGLAVKFMKTNLMKFFSSHLPLLLVSDVNMVAEPKVSVLLAGNTLVSFLFFFYLKSSSSWPRCVLNNTKRVFSIFRSRPSLVIGASDGPKATEHDKNGK